VSVPDSSSLYKSDDSENKYSFTIAKAQGATVALGQKNLSSTSNSITVSGITAPTNGQIVQFAISETTTPGTWQDGTAFTGLFTGLKASTTYNVFVRSKDNVNYNAGATASASIETDAVSVPKKPGADVVFAQSNLSSTTNSITVSGVAKPANQEVEYVINTTSTAPATGWITTTVFTGLTANTTYYVFARSKENTNYYAGAIVNASIATKSSSSSGGGCQTSCSGYTPILSQIETGNRALHIAGGLSLSVSSSATVSIYSLNGNLVKSLSYASGEHTMSLNSLPKGMYVAKVSFRNKENTLSHSESIKITVK
jgi:hypothetical protein